jgi:Mg-chelatase subunit ChlD
MNILCVHCGESFSITQKQLGTRGRCPHCRAQVELPRADEHEYAQTERLEPPVHWLENSMSGVIACVIHLAILVFLAMLPWGNLTGGQDESGQLVNIGKANNTDLTDTDDQRLNESELKQDLSEATESLVEEPLPPTANQSDNVSANVNVVSPGGGASAAAFSSSSSNSSLGAGNESFGDMVSRLKRDGLDIVITFDSTSSMGGEITQVKRQIKRIGSTLHKLVPKTRISVCTYRDVGDSYVVKGIPLSSNLSEVIVFLDGIQPGGGNDVPEAVDAGLEWATENNTFRHQARKVILLFGDAPPHPQKQNRCLKLAADFHSQQNGIISTITCRSRDDKPLDDFVEIAQAGGGEAYLTRDERELMAQLVILVFGSQHRGKVLEAFDMLEDQ